MMRMTASWCRSARSDPMLDRGTKAMSVIGAAPPRFVIFGSLSCRPKKPSRRRAQDDALGHLAGSCQAPQCNQQLAGEGEDHRLARCRATVGGARLEPFDERALFLEQQKAPSQLQ